MNAPVQQHARRMLVERLGRRPYEPVLEYQRDLQRAVRDEDAESRLLLVEHEPVITLGRNHPVPDLRVAPAAVAAAGIPIVQAERGGDITYHGPGQIVAYPVVDLRAWGLGPVDFVAGLEEAVIALLGGYRLRGERRPGARGAWVGERKIASVGVNVRRGVTMHGVAVNVDLALEPFALINACGLPGVEMTSIARELGRAVALDEACGRFLAAFCSVFGTAPPGPDLGGGGGRELTRT